PEHFSLADGSYPRECGPLLASAALVALPVHDLPQWDASTAAPGGCFGRVSERDHGPDQARRGDAEQLLHLIAAPALEPAGASADAVSQGGQHQPLAQTPLVERVLLRPAAGHDENDRQGRASDVMGEALGPGELTQGLWIADEHELPRLLIARAA